MSDKKRGKTHADLVDELRAEIGFHKTQQMLADKFGVSRSYICEVLNCRKKIGPDLAAAMGYEPKYFKKRN